MSIEPNNSFYKLYYKLISYDKARFIIVGAVGFIVNFIGLTIFYNILKIDIVISQIVAAELAVISTFFGNNFWTFRFDHHHTFKNKLVRYHLSSLAGIIINDLIVILLVHYAKLYYGLALVVGSLAALAWNYTLYKKIVFRPNEVSK